MCGGKELLQRALGIDAASTTPMHNRWVLLLECPLCKCVLCVSTEILYSVLHQRALGIDAASLMFMQNMLVLWRHAVRRR